MTLHPTTVCSTTDVSAILQPNHLLNGLDACEAYIDELILSV